MEPQIVERVSTLETDVAVIQSNYVRKDELSALHEELGTGFAKTDTGFAKMDTKFAKVDTDFAKADARIDVGFARIETMIERSTKTLLKWVFASQISVAAMFIAAIKYL